MSALRVLSDAVGTRMLAPGVTDASGAPDLELLRVTYGNREFLGPGALANLALAFPEDEVEPAGLLDLALARAADTTHAWSASPIDQAAMLEACVDQHRHGDISRLAGQLLSRLEIGALSERATILAALARTASAYRTEDDPALALTIDGATIAPSVRGEGAALFELPFSDVRAGPHALVARRTDGAPVFLSLDGRWNVPIGEPETAARGARVTLHRILETPGGSRIEGGSHVSLGALVRVRLFVYLEGSAPSLVAVRDAHAAGLEVMDPEDESSPLETLLRVLGASPDDEDTDPRARLARDTQDRISRETHETHASTWYLSQLYSGLYELTYIARATTPGTFTLPPAMIEAQDDDGFVARSAASAIVIDGASP